MAEEHIPVMLKETLEGLNPVSGGVYIDATLGLGGHAEAILEASSPKGRLLAIDRDSEAIGRARVRLERFGSRLDIVKSRFSGVKACAERLGYLPANGILADLGVSSLQLDSAPRGFSFQKSGPLDMRMDASMGLSAEAWLSEVSVEALARVFRDLGELPKSGKVAAAIVRARNDGLLTNTQALAEVVLKAIGAGARPRHPATRVFQAIRMFVNEELDELRSLLEALPDILEPGGRAAVISFHSLEDRMVKRSFEVPQKARWPHRMPVEAPALPKLWKRVTKKPLTASSEELSKNPRARSAKLRVAERLPQQEGQDRVA